jgi:NAD(P)-dependent dehydrogenase (short-subunit alcohol dehydrogenase family)
MTNMTMSGKVVVVTGGGRNVGKAVAFEFARRGASVAIAEANAETGSAVAKEVAETATVEATSHLCDVSNSSDVQHMVGAVIERFGRIDFLVNNVAISDHTPILDLDVHEWDRVLQVSLTSVFLCTKYVAKAMVAGGRGGVIINLGSTSGLRGRSEATAYPAAKGALPNLTRTMAIQLSPYNIRANIVIPNRVGSPVGKSDELDAPPRKVKNLLGRPASPEDIAKAIAFLCSDDASFITGTELLVDGGSMLARDLD